MGQVSTKAIVAGVAGALGVVATTQVPMVQAAVDQLANIATDSERVTTTHEASAVVDNDDKQVTTKSDVVRDKVLAAAPKISLRAVANVAPVAPATDKVGDVELLANSEAEVSSSATAVYTPATSSVATSAAVTPAEQAVVSEAEATTEKPADTITYTIKDGDTLGQLAAQYGVSVAAIQALNPGVDVTMLQIGQIVYIPAAGSATAMPASVAASEVPAVASVAPSEAPAVAESSVVSQTSVAPSEAPVVSETSVVSEAPVASAESSVVSEAPVIVSEAPAEAPAASVATSEAAVAPSEAATVASEAPASDYVNAPVAVQGGLTASQRTAIVNAALKYAGQDIPYVWGGKTPDGFDCSGLAAWVFNDAGLSLPSYTVSEEAYVSTTDVKTPADVIATAQPGDLLFWGDHGSSWHVAIYIGNGQYVAAPAPGYNVRVENVTTGFMPAFVGSYNA